MNLSCPHCQNAFEIIADDSDTEVTCPSCQSKVSLLDFLSINAAVTRTMAGAPDRFSPPLGSKVGQFMLEERLGKGGFGTVYKAFDRQLERYVALKIPRAEKMSRRQAEVFIHEAQSAAQLQDPNIVSVFEVGRDEGRIYIVSELIDGTTLDQWSTTEKPSQHASAKMIAEIARSIHRAHQKGIVHRDLKPKNVIIDGQGSPHVTDFGLAKRENPEEITITTKGTVIGTPAYMSPEQAMGKSNEADGRTDVYSLGVMLYELIAGQRPFRGQTDVLTEEILRGEKPEPRSINPNVHPDVEAICLKAMARRPGDRFDSALELAEDLERFSANEPTLTRPLNRIQKATRFAARHSLQIGIAALVLGSVTFGIVAALSKPDGIAQADITHDIEFKVSPPDSTVSIVKVDYHRGKIDYSTLHEPEKDDADPGLRSDKLSPGWYVLETVSPQGDIQEVWRYVPKTTKDRPNMDYACTNWSLTDSGGIAWQKVSVKAIDDSKPGLKKIGNETLLTVHGDRFEAGAIELYNLDGENPIRPPKDIVIYDYYIGQNEVTVGNFLEVMKKLPIEMRRDYTKKTAPLDEPVGNITFVEALDYCERIGARLPVFEEYLFAATNGGETKLPWGDEWAFNSWPLGMAGLQVDDKNQIGVRNLYSSQLEWTQDYAVPIDTVTNSTDWGGDTNPLTAGLKHSRLAVGGPMSALEGSVESVDNVLGPRKPFVMQLDNAHQFSGLGFRCYRSKTPRLKPVNPVIGYVTTAGTRTTSDN